MSTWPQLFIWELLIVLGYTSEKVGKNEVEKWKKLQKGMLREFLLWTVRLIPFGSMKEPCGVPLRSVPWRLGLRWSFCLQTSLFLGWGLNPLYFWVVLSTGREISYASGESLQAEKQKTGGMWCGKIVFLCLWKCCSGGGGLGTWLSSNPASLSLLFHCSDRGRSQGTEGWEGGWEEWMETRYPQSVKASSGNG